MVRKIPKVLVLQSAGTNCNKETIEAFAAAGAEAQDIHVNDLIKGYRKINDYQIMAIPGGFTFGDDISAGKVLANKIKFRLRDSLEDFLAAKKPVIGICNGFQVLVKLGLLPDVKKKREQEATLAINNSGKFEDRWVYLNVNEKSPCIFTCGNQIKKIFLPIAHAEGRFVITNKSVLSRMEKRRQVVLRYCNPDGKPDGYPWNPNGSVNNIAGICDASGLVFGLMPHPERFYRRLQHPRWTREELSEEGDGLLLFRNAVEYVRNGL